MDAMRSWVINICTTIFFITAVEMLLPNDKLKKYSKFVLGLILMTVIINPLVKFLNKGTEVTAFINKTTSSMDQIINTDNTKYKDKGVNDVLTVFKTNLEKLCEKKLKEKYPKLNCKAEATVTYDKEEQQPLISGIKIRMNDGTVGTVGTVGKVDINAAGGLDKQSEDNSEQGEEIKNYLSGVLDIPEGKIAVYKLTK
ncbi:MAG: stage III sporulation protein AF [Bacillota bacterium]|nr:stage III sporulation protein AF [Bacillota bacterium]